MRHTSPLSARWLLIALGLPAVLGVAPAAMAQTPPFSSESRDAGAESVADLFQRLPSPNAPPSSESLQGRGSRGGDFRSDGRRPSSDIRGVDIDELRPPSTSQSAVSEGGLLGASLYGSERAARIVENELYIPPLIAPTTDQSSIGNSVLPTDRGSQALGHQRPLPEGPDREGGWAATGYLWQAPNTYSYPLYFEDVMLERHGHERLGCLQPLAAGTRFFATIPMLPYLMAVRDPSDCDYHLGYYQVGSCAPPLLQRPPYDRRAVLIEAGFIGGMIAIFP